MHWLRNVTWIVVTLNIQSLAFIFSPGVDGWQVTTNKIRNSKSTLQSHSACHDDKDDVVLNPETKRLIKVNGPRWREMMHQSGGYIFFGNELLPIKRKSLWRWQREKQQIVNGSEILNEDFKNQKRQWHLVSSKNFIVEESTYNNDESLPFLDQLLFVHKNEGLLTLPGIGPEKQRCLSSLVNTWLNSKDKDASLLLDRCRQSAFYNNSNHDKKKKKRENKNSFVPRPCHRLDFDTSGVLVLALSRDALRLTNSLFASKITTDSGSDQFQIQKTYVALVAGHVRNNKETVEFPIGKVYNPENDYNEFACFTSNMMGDGTFLSKDSFIEGSLRTARTEVTVLQRFSLPVFETDSSSRATTADRVVHYTRVQLKPITGRGHQLRLHMAAIGHPILGDRLHAPDDVAGATPRLCLHAEALAMPVRVTKMNDESKISHHASIVRVTSLPPF